MLAQRHELIARIERVERENKKLQAALHLGAGPRLLQSPAGVAAVLLVLLAGLAGGLWAGSAQQAEQQFMNGVF
jgi:hypothetical protein